MGENPERAAGIYISGIGKMCAARYMIRKGSKPERLLLFMVFYRSMSISGVRVFSVCGDSLFRFQVLFLFFQCGVAFTEGGYFVQHGFRVVRVYPKFQEFVCLIAEMRKQKLFLFGVSSDRLVEVCCSVRRSR